MSTQSIHCILVSDSKLPTYIPLTGPTVEDAIRELLADKAALLIEAGLDRNWLDTYGMEPLDEEYYPCFQNETRFVRWHGVFGDSESDDLIVDGYFVDFATFNEEWCALFVNAVGEVWIDYTEAITEEELFRNLLQGDLGDFGFEFDSEDCNAAFPLEWLVESLPHYTKRYEIAPGVVGFFWDRTAECEEWGELRCFVFKR